MAYLLGLRPSNAPLQKGRLGAQCELVDLYECLLAAGTRRRLPRVRIASVLNAERFVTRRGTPWRFQYVARVLTDRLHSSTLSTAA